MFNRIKNLKNKYKLYDLFYPIVVAIIILQLYISEIRLGVITSFIIILLIYKNLKKQSLFFNSSINKMVLLYLIYNSVSIILFLFKGFPISVFFAEWSNSILPICFFYFAQIERNPNDNFYRFTLDALVVSFVIGFILWIWDPPFYRVFMDITEGPGTDLLFFESIFGLTATGALGYIAFLLSSYRIFKTKGRSGKIYLVVSMVTTILTFRRGALFVLALAILIMHFIGYFRFRFLKKRYFVLEFIFLYCIILLVTANYEDFFTNLTERATMLSEAFNERSTNWVDAFNQGNLLIGGGLGAFGHKVSAYSKIFIADGNYFKMLAEIGIIGTILFITIIISSVFAGFRDFRNKYLEIGIVIGLSLIAIGSNIFEYQIIVPTFWYAIGRLANNNKAGRSIDKMVYVDSEF